MSNENKPDAVLTAIDESQQYADQRPICFGQCTVTGQAIRKARTEYVTARDGYERRIAELESLLCEMYMGNYSNDLLTKVEQLINIKQEAK
jgi:hypothetical protein